MTVVLLLCFFSSDNHRRESLNQALWKWNIVLDLKLGPCLNKNQKSTKRIILESPKSL